LRAEDPATTAVVLQGHSGEITTAAIEPYSQWLATGSRDASVRLWYLKTDDLLAEASSVATRNLSAKEWDQYFPFQPYRKTFSHLPVSVPENQR